MDSHVKVGGVWKTLEGIHTRVGGVWKEVKNGYIRVGGVWKQFYANVRVILTGSLVSPNIDTDFSLGGTAQAGWNFLTTGDLTRIASGAWSQPEWFGQPGDTTHQTPDATYYIRATNAAGDNPDGGSALNTWLALSTLRQWYWQAGPGFVTSAGTLKIEIATDVGGTDIVATGYYRGIAEAEL